MMRTDKNPRARTGCRVRLWLGWLPAAVLLVATSGCRTVVTEGDTRFHLSNEGESPGANEPAQTQKRREWLFTPRTLGGKWHGRGAELSYAARIPELADTPLGRRVTLWLKDQVRRQFAADRREHQPSVREWVAAWIEGGRTIGEFTRDVHWRVQWEDANYISVVATDRVYSGGAHGNTHFEAANFMSREGRCEPVTLEQLMSGDDWRSTLTGLIEADLERQGASEVSRGAVEEVLQAQLWAADARGIEFLFGPYAVGSFAEGEYRALIPWAQVAHWVKPCIASKLPPPGK